MKNYEKIENEITMAEKQKQQATRTTIDELNETLSGVERRVEGNKKMIVWVVVAILVVFGIAGGFFYGSKMSKEDAKEAIGVADIARMNGQDSVAVAEYLKVSEEYGNTVGNRATLEAAVILYQQGKYAEAAKSLEDYSAEENLVGAMAKSLLGDCNVNLKKYDEALKNYDAAISVADGNKMLVPYCMMKKATVLSSQKKHSEAAAIYDEINKKYPQFAGMNQIDVERLIERENFRANSK